MNDYIFENCSVGLKQEFEVSISSEMLTSFRDLTGDLNPLHNDEDFAVEQGFEGRVAYGMLTASFLSTLVGMYLPGKYCIIQEENLMFKAPVYIGDTLKILGEVAEKNEMFKRITLKVRITNQKGKCVARGTMQIGFLKYERA